MAAAPTAVDKCTPTRWPAGGTNAGQRLHKATTATTATMRGRVFAMMCVSGKGRVTRMQCSALLVKGHEPHYIESNFAALHVYTSSMQRQYSTAVKATA